MDAVRAQLAAGAPRIRCVARQRALRRSVKRYEEVYFKANSVSEARTRKWPWGSNEKPRSGGKRGFVDLIDTGRAGGRSPHTGGPI
jgi:hypothetical protein